MRWINAAPLPVVLTLLASCGGSDQPVPNVEGQRLDVAKSTLEDAGHDTEVIGGGTFGVVDESNWTVCETEPSAGAVPADKVKLVVDRECDDSGRSGSTEPQESNVTPEAEDPTPADEPQVDPPAKKVVVPNVVGMNHQAAQNRMQAAGLYMLDEEDATGLGRLLLYDRNWVVVGQSPAPGRRVSENRTITLRAKKIGE